MTELWRVFPEIILFVTFLGIVLAEISYYGETIRLLSSSAYLGLGGAFVYTLISYRAEPVQLFSNTLVFDSFALYFKCLAILLAGLGVFSVSRSRETPEHTKPGFFALMIAFALSVCVTAGGSNLLLIFLGYQLGLTIMHFLAGYNKNSSLSAEAAMKSLLVSAVSTALFLYACSLVFSATHTLNIFEIHKLIVQGGVPRGPLLLVFFLFLFSLSAGLGWFPMNWLLPDLLQGAPTSASAFLSVGGRLLSGGACLRILLTLFFEYRPGAGWTAIGSGNWGQVLLLLSSITMILGALLAYRQRTAKRMVAFIAVSQAGLLMMGLAAGDTESFSAFMYSMFVEMICLVGCYHFLSALLQKAKSDEFEDLAQALPQALPDGLAFLFCLSCLVGVPPFPGFVTRFLLLGAAVRHHFYFSVLMGLCSAALLAVCAGRLGFSVVKALPSQSVSSTTKKQWLGFSLFVLPLFFITFFAERFLDFASRSLPGFFW